MRKLKKKKYDTREGNREHHQHCHTVGQKVSRSLEPVFTAKLVVLPVDVDCVRKVQDLYSISHSVADPPAFSECVQVPDHRPVRLHVLVSSEAVVVSAQPSDRVLVGAGQYDL